MSKEFEESGFGRSVKQETVWPPKTITIKKQERPTVEENKNYEQSTDNKNETSN